MRATAVRSANGAGPPAGPALNTRAHDTRRWTVQLPLLIRTCSMKHHSGTRAAGEAPQAGRSISGAASQRSSSNRHAPAPAPPRVAALAAVPQKCSPPMARQLRTHAHACVCVADTSPPSAARVPLSHPRLAPPTAQAQMLARPARVGRLSVVSRRRGGAATAASRASCGPIAGLPAPTHRCCCHQAEASGLVGPRRTCRRRCRRLGLHACASGVDISGGGARWHAHPLVHAASYRALLRTPRRAPPPAPTRAKIGGA